MTSTQGAPPTAAGGGVRTVAATVLRRTIEDHDTGLADHAASVIHGGLGAR